MKLERKDARRIIRNLIAKGMLRPGADQKDLGDSKFMVETGFGLVFIQVDNVAKAACVSLVDDNPLGEIPVDFEERVEFFIVHFARARQPKQD